MPNHTVSGNVDTMMRAADNAAIRSAIGVGQTDAPTFLAQTLTGQSLTGTQATSLVDLAATWNTTGNPSLIYGRVTNTNSGTTANLIDLGTFAGGSLFSVTKAGALTAQSLGITQTATANIFSTTAAALQTAGYLGVARAINLIDTAGISWSSTSALLGATGTNLLQDAPGILAQRNGDNAQSFRVYDSYNTAGANFCRANLSFNSNRFELSISSLGTGSTTRGFDIGTNGTGDITFFTSGSNKWRIAGTTGHLLATSDNAYDIGAATTNRPANINAASSIRGEYFSLTSGLTGITRSYLQSPSTGVVAIYNAAGSDFSRLQLGGTTSAFPAIKRNGTGIDIRLADDSTFTTINASDYTGYNGGVAKTYVGGAGVFQAVSTGYFALCSSATNVFTQDTFLSRSAPGVWQMGTSSTNATADLRLRSVIQQPPATITPANNGDLVVEATSNTLLTFKFKGSDGTVRSGTLVVA